MLVIVAGAIGIGKTTVCRKLIEIARNRGYTCGGIVTYKTSDKNIIIEDIQSGETETLASADVVYDGPHTAKYSFSPEGIDFGIIDQIGKFPSHRPVIQRHANPTGLGQTKDLEVL